LPQDSPMLTALPLPILIVAVLTVATLLIAGLRRRSTACVVGAGCVLALTVGFAISASLLA
jgi:hypothetical protein